MYRFSLKVVSFLLVAALFAAGCASATSGNTGNSTGRVSTVTITSTVETSGNLSADQLVTLKWGTSGLVDQVSVKVGDKVKKGDVLAILKSDSAPAEVLSAMAELASAQRDLLDMQDSTAALAAAQQKVVTTRKDVEEAQNILNALDYPRATDVWIKYTEAKIQEAEKTLMLLTRKYKEVQRHPDGDPQKTQAIIDMTNAQMALNELKATLNWYLAKPTQADYDEAKAALDVARAALDNALRARDKVKGGYDQLDFDAAQAKIAAAQAKVDVLAIIAPFDGEVISLMTAAANSVSDGDAAIGLVNRDSIKIDVQVDETSISNVTVGNLAQITMDSLPGQTLTGKVSMINPIGATVSGLVKYTVTVRLDPTDAKLLFGATASVVLVTSEPHAMLAVPINAVQTDSQGEYVNVVGQGGSSQRVDIESGELSGGLVTITTSGSLEEGDKVELSTTSSSASSSTSSSASSSSSSSNRNNNRGGPQNGGFPLP